MGRILSKVSLWTTKTGEKGTRNAPYATAIFLMYLMKDLLSSESDRNRKKNWRTFSNDGHSNWRRQKFAFLRIGKLKQNPFVY